MFMLTMDLEAAAQDIHTLCPSGYEAYIHHHDYLTSILLPPSPEVVTNCREAPLRGVRTISIKHNFLMQRLQGDLVEIIRIEYSLQPALRVGARGLVQGST